MSRVAESQHRWTSRLQAPDRQAIAAAGRTVTEMVQLLERLENDERASATQVGTFAQTG